MKDEEKQENYEVADRLLAEQNFPAALIVGASTTLFGAVAYGTIVNKWPFAYGFVAAAVGIVIGLSMGFAGRGISTKFAVAAALYAVLSCLLGNLFAGLVNAAGGDVGTAFGLIVDTPLSELARRSVAGVSPVDLIYVLIAVCAAAFFARRPLSRSQRLALGTAELRG